MGRKVTIRIRRGQWRLLMLVTVVSLAALIWLLGPSVTALPQSWQAMSANQINAGWRVGAGLLGLVCPGCCLLLLVFLLRARPVPRRESDGESGPDAA